MDEICSAVVVTANSNKQSRFITILFAIAVAALCGNVALARPGVIARASQPVPGEYIVLFQSTTPSVAARAAVTAHNGSVVMEFPDIHGLYVRMRDADALALTYDLAVTSIEENAYSHFAGTQSGVDTPYTSGDGGIVNASSWGLDRIDQTSPASRLDNSYSWCVDGSGVRVYILDSGVLSSHPEFGGRVEDQGSPGTTLQNYLNSQGVNFGTQCWTQSGQDALSPLGAHGTGVASIAAGSQLGVAKGATIVDARSAPCNGQGTNAFFTAVIDWICRLDTHRVAGQSVINISSVILGQSSDANALSAQIATAVDTYNIPVVVSAGNFNDNVFWYSPANAARAITVGGLNRDSDTRWCCFTVGSTTFGSNYGFGTAFYAPAQRVEAASTTIRQIIPALDHDYYRSELNGCANDYADTCTSGTSFAAPHMTGVVARYLQRQPGATRDAIVSTLQSMNQTYAGGACVTEPNSGPCVPVLVFKECP
jgi:subtilisin family serine protease